MAGESEDFQKLIVSLEANIKKYEKELARATGIATASTTKIQRNFDAMNGRVTAGLTKLAATAAGAFGFAALVAFSRKMIDVADEIGETAAALGVTNGKLQELRFAAKLAGIEAGDLDKILFKLARQASGADGDVDDFARALGKLGITVASLKGKKPDEVFALIADRLDGVTDASKRIVIAADLAGDKLGVKLLKMVNGGSAALAEFAKRAHAAGIILSDETIDKADKAANEFDTLGLAARTAGTHFAVGLLPSLVELRKLVTDPGFQQSMRDLGDSFGTMIKWMVEHKDTITVVTAALAGAWAGGKIGRIGGGAGAALGAIAGGAAAALAAIQKLTPEMEQVNRELTGLSQREKAVRELIANTYTDEETKIGLSRQLLEIEFKRQDALKRRAALQAEITKKEAEAAAAQKTAAETVQPGGNKITVTPWTDPDVVKAMEDLAFKTRLARGEFGLLAEGFPELMHGFKGTKELIEKFNGSLDSIPELMRKANDSMRMLNAAKDLNKAADDFGKAFGRAFEDAIIRAKSFKDVLKSLGEELARIALRLLFTNQLERSLKSAFLGVVPGLGLPLAAAAAGPRLPLPNPASPRNGSGPNIYITNQINAQGADPAGLTRVQHGLEELKSTLELQVGGMLRAREVRNTRYGRR